MIEIERKFLLTEKQQEDLLDGATELGQKIVEDSYFDSDTFTLTRDDFWLRERNGEYELKAPLKSGDGLQRVTNRYNEITEVAEIALALGFNPELDFETSLAHAGIKEFMTCIANRRSYEKQGFHIDVDTATYPGSTFQYAVAEIELLIESEPEADEAEGRIVEFAHQFNLATDQLVLGKVAAFLESDRKEHYQVLVEAGVLR